jgi:hypothetical protein
MQMTLHGLLVATRLSDKKGISRRSQAEAREQERINNKEGAIQCPSDISLMKQENLPQSSFRRRMGKAIRILGWFDYQWLLRESTAAVAERKVSAG